MEEIKKRKTRMYDPWGYQEENDYQSVSIITENDLASFFADVSYNEEDNKIHFSNKDGEEVATLDTSGFTSGVIENVEYADGILKIKFTNGQTIEVDMTELIEENEFGNGLVVNEGVVSVLVDSESEGFLSVGENGVKLSGIQGAIDASVEAEKVRAEGEEARIESSLNDKIDTEKARAEGAESDLQDAIDAEKSRAESAEGVLDGKIATEKERAEDAENLLDQRVDGLNEALGAERTAREGRDTYLENQIIAETTRATSKENALDAKIDAEIARATSAETALDEKIEDLPSPEEMDKIVDYLGYKDNETLVTNNEHEAAFGEYNLSKTSAEASGQTIFTIGNGTSDSNRSNAVEVMKNGDVYMLVEGEMMNINKLLGQIAHEIYD